jgi:hypothetical protein
MLQIGPGNDQDGESSRSSNDDRRVNNEPPGDVKPSLGLMPPLRWHAAAGADCLVPANGRQCSYGANRTPTPINTIPIAIIIRSTVSHSGIRGIAWSSRYTSFVSVEDGQI